MQKDKATLRQHLEMAWKASGVRPQQLEPVPFPQMFVYAWGWFLELNAVRQNNGFSAMPISYTELLAWSQLTERPLNPLDVRVLKLLDDVAMKPKES